LSLLPLRHHSPLFVITSEGEGSAVSLSFAAEAEEENCRSLGFAPSKNISKKRHPHRDLSAPVEMTKERAALPGREVAE
jgi:hypothetical protein